MNLKNVYWYFDGAFSPKLCDEIIKYGNQHSELLALTGAQKEKKLEEEDIKDLKQKRDSNIVWLSDKWIYKEIHLMLIQLTIMLVGILNGIGPKLVNLQNID